MVTIQLYMGWILFDNNKYMSNFANKTAQNNYFSSHADLTLTDDCKFTKYEEPILLYKSFDELFNYKYGRIRIDDNGDNWVYFSIQKFVIETANKTWMNIDIDPWETFRYRTYSLSLGRGRIIRSSLNKSEKIMTALQPKFKNTKQLYDLRSGSYLYNNYCLVILIHNSQTNKDWIAVVKVTSLETLWNFLSPHCIHYVANALNVTDDDVIGAWLSPFMIDTNNYVAGGITYSWDDHSLGDLIVKAEYYDTFLENISKGYQTQTKTLNTLWTSPDDEMTIGITDLRDNLVWVSDNESSYNTVITLSFAISYGSCGWNGYIKKDDNIQYSEGLFTIPCEILDYFSDAFISYNVQQRPFIERQRAIQREQALVNSIGNIGQTAVMGGIGGNPMGALAGGIIAGIGAGVDYFATDYYNKEYQENEDRQAKAQTDTLKVNGMAILDIIQGRTYCKIVSIESDAQTLAEYRADITAYGYFYNVEDYIENWVSTDAKLTVNTNEIESIPSAYVGNIQNRLAKGVIFIRPT